MEYVASCRRERGKVLLPKMITTLSSKKRADAQETLADVQEATEQRMHSVADLLPQKTKRSTSVSTDCLRVPRSTAAKLSAAVPKTTNRLLTEDLP